MKVCQFQAECDREASEKVDIVVDGEPFNDVWVCQKHTSEATEQ